MRPTRTSGLVACMMGLVLGSGCAGGFYNAPVKPPAGLLFTKVSAPLTPDVSGVAIANRELVKTYTETTFILEPILGTSYGFGDASIEAAIRQHNENNQVSYADYEYLNVFGMYASIRINVYSTRKGEGE